MQSTAEGQIDHKSPSRFRFWLWCVWVSRRDRCFHLKEEQTRTEGMHTKWVNPEHAGYTVLYSGGSGQPKGAQQLSLSLQRCLTWKCRVCCSAALSTASRPLSLTTWRQLYLSLLVLPVPPNCRPSCWDECVRYSRGHIIKSTLEISILESYTISVMLRLFHQALLHLHEEITVFTLNLVRLLLEPHLLKSFMVWRQKSHCRA